MKYFDAHCDTATEIYEKNQDLFKNDLHIDIEKASNISAYAQVFAVFGDYSKDLTNRFENTYNYFTQMLKENESKIALVSNRIELENAVSNGKIAAILSIEGAEVLNCSPIKLEAAYNLGVRMTGITWNYDNALSGCSKISNTKGLTAQGKSYVQKANELNILVDVSHVSDAAFFDIAATGSRFLASHSNSRAVCAHSRNLTDEQFILISRTGGVAGINLYADFLTNGKKCTLTDVIRHIEHFAALCGTNNIAIGADFDGCERLPEGINTIADMHRLSDELVKLNYNQNVIDNIFFNNLFNLFQTAL